MSDETRPDKIVSADGSAPKPYPDADVDLVTEEIAEAFNAGNNACTIPADFTEEARAVLDALAEAGRLLPDGAMADVMLADQTHTYWSTHCRHGSHQLCESNAITGLTVVSERPVAIGKVPARCKGCASPCICPCHVGPGGGYGFMERAEALRLTDTETTDGR